MEYYDFCFAWNWEYDSDFVKVLDRACQCQGVSLFQVTPENLNSTLLSLGMGQVSFYSYLDRASDTDERFQALAQLSNPETLIRINRFDLAHRTWDKAAMHRKFVNAGLDAPYTVILPSFSKQPDLPPLDLQTLGGWFAIKPAHGGGGKGVVANASSWEQVLAARCEYSEDEYLLQAQVLPTSLAGRPAWFRVIYCMGQIFACWWDPCTHFYTPLTTSELNSFDLFPLLNISKHIAQLCQLELYSTEIALTPTGRFEIVDYINDPIDLRLQSSYTEGVPDSIIHSIADHLANHVSIRYPVTKLDVW